MSDWKKRIEAHRATGGAIINLANADLANADLVGINLVGIDLTGANLTGANLTGARYTAATKWPKGIDVELTGAKLIR